jgi:hypothetical protein
MRLPEDQATIHPPGATGFCLQFADCLRKSALSADKKSANLRSSKQFVRHENARPRGEARQYVWVRIGYPAAVSQKLRICHFHALHLRVARQESNHRSRYGKRDREWAYGSLATCCPAETV